MNPVALSFKNEQTLSKVESCGCYFCCAIFECSKIKEYLIEDDGKRTAVCPFCGIDALIPITTESNLTEEKLKEFYKKIFKGE